VEQLTLAGVLAESSNVGTVMAGQNVPDETRWEFMSRFGFGKKTGVELLNETPGILHKPGTPQWDGRTRNVVLFGQGVSVNALQATQVFATLGNGGVAVAPHLVKGYTCADGVFQAKDVGTGNRVVSSTTASQVVAMMESVVDSGTGTTAQIEGYRVAGKTGTSQILQAAADGSIETWHVGSFVGVAPADNPRIAVGVFIFRPRTTEYGSTVAGPVFKELMTTGLERLGVPPSTTQPAELPLTW
jgi:cell division protein FtsI (penicillin-binding protein 3)